MIYVFLADGFEEVEALGVIDVCRRAGLKVRTVSIMDREMVEGAHGIGVLADSQLGDDSYKDAEMLFLPGGMPGGMDRNRMSSNDTDNSNNAQADMNTPISV